MLILEYFYIHLKSQIIHNFSNNKNFYNVRNCNLEFCKKIFHLFWNLFYALVNFLTVATYSLTNIIFTSTILMSLYRGLFMINESCYLPIIRKNITLTYTITNQSRSTTEFSIWTKRQLKMFKTIFQVSLDD